MAVVVIMSIIISSSIVSSEFSMGTIKLLMVRPVNRIKILLSIYLTTVMMLCLFTILFIVFHFIVGAIFIGFDGIDGTFLYLKKDKVAQTDFLPYLSEKIMFNLIIALVTASLAFMLSTVLRSSPFAMALALFVSLLGPDLSGYLISKKYTWAKYVLFTHMDLNWYLDGLKPPLKGITINFSLTILAIYYLAFLLTAFITFKKRDIST
jgi:ABC-2 type transport system permease protein